MKRTKNLTTCIPFAEKLITVGDLIGYVCVRIKTAPVRTRRRTQSRWAALWIAGLLCGAVSKASAAEPILTPAPPVVCTFDLHPLNQLDLEVTANAVRVWDTLHVVAALQGLANSESPRLYLFYCDGFGVDTDQFWLDWFRGEDGWLRGTRIVPLTDLQQVVQTFRGVFKGLVVYDPAVPATAIAASTAAGCEGLLPIRFDRQPGSIYDLLVHRMKLPIALWLINEDGSSKFTGHGRVPDSDEASSGSAKIDVHRWALRRYLASGKCAAGFAAYYVDSFWLKHPAQGGAGMHTL